MLIRKTSGAFTGGVFGALVASVSLWLLANAGVLAMVGIRMKVHFSPAWLYPRLVWGGVWALLLVLPFLRGRIALRGMLFSLAPSAMMLFKLLPEAGKGLLGLKLGSLTPLMVVLLNFVYGLVAAYWYKAAAE